MPTMLSAGFYDARPDCSYRSPRSLHGYDVCCDIFKWGFAALKAPVDGRMLCVTPFERCDAARFSFDGFEAVWLASLIASAWSRAASMRLSRNWNAHVMMVVTRAMPTTTIGGTKMGHVSG